MEGQRLSGFLIVCRLRRAHPWLYRIRSRVLSHLQDDVVVTLCLCIRSLAPFAESYGRPVATRSNGRRRHVGANRIPQSLEEGRSFDHLAWQRLLEQASLSGWLTDPARWKSAQKRGLCLLKEHHSIVQTRDVCD